MSILSQTSAVTTAQLRLMWRERRLLWLALTVLVLVCASLASNTARLTAQADERRAVAQEEARLWDSQGVMDPHDAAHVGRALPAPVRPLAAFDPGLSDFVGTSVFIEAHAQNPARHRPIEGGAALSRFGGFSAAWTLQVVAPLLIVLAGFATLSGEVARARLQQELGAGALTSPLVAGRLIALLLAAGLLVLVMMVVSLPAILLQGAGQNELTALLASTVIYFFYLFIFCCLTVAVSGLFSSARTALVILLGFWAVSTLLVPRIAPAVAETLEATPSAPAFRSAVTEEAERGVDVHDPNDEGVIAFQVELMTRYGVSNLDELPINIRGASYEYGEQLSTELYNRHFDELYDVYADQEIVQRTFAIFSPTISIQPFSRALAGTDFNTHLNYLRDVEDYRYRLIQKLNTDMKANKPPPGERYYLADIATITQDVTYAPENQSLGETLSRQLPNAGFLFAWILFGLALVAISARRLGRLS